MGRVKRMPCVAGLQWETSKLFVAFVFLTTGMGRGTWDFVPRVPNEHH